ncbi:hypothetical protein ROLI_031210 [Roseobacter fucihabitans]|uniref:Uncharacterized protein n=1 Tax=Roseobacter fucihabitans TaxID=1537242 RepID=A0ABZ2BX28_9RHOB|nr:hypothetical protein [Roseobacter litoralis]
MKSFADALRCASKARPQFMCGLVDPERQSGAVDIDALSRIDLRLTIQWQMVGILRDNHTGDSRLGRHPIFDQLQFGRRVHNSSFT